MTPPTSPIRRREVLLVLSSVMVTVLMGMSIMVPVLPLYAQSFGVTSALVGAVIAAFGLARIFMDIPAGHWSERYGRRPFIIAGPAVFTVASLLCGLATDFWLLLLFRFFQGLGSALYTTAAMSVLSDISTREDRGRIMSIYQGTLLFGTGIGPVVGGLVAQGYGIRAPFYFSAALGLAATLWALWRIPETRPMMHPADLLPHGRIPAQEGAREGLRTLLLNPNFLLVGLIAFSMHFTHTGARQTIVPLLGYNQLGLSEAQIGFAVTVISFIDLFVIYFGGLVADRFGRKLAIVPSSVIGAASLVLFALGQDYAFFLFSAVVFGISRGIAGPAPMAFAADIASKGSYGLASGLYRTLADIGLMLGPVALGWIADAADFQSALYFNAGLLVVAALLFGALARETVRGPEPEPVLAEADG
ncbi:MAG TPA: MFS transporter [Dehalococcoidia bacterium]|nr:MFS transporter [Dehalococcoidia bacterium]